MGRDVAVVSNGDRRNRCCAVEKVGQRRRSAGQQIRDLALPQARSSLPRCDGDPAGSRGSRSTRGWPFMQPSKTQARACRSSDGNGWSSTIQASSKSAVERLAVGQHALSVTRRGGATAQDARSRLRRALAGVEYSWILDQDPSVSCETHWDWRPINPTHRAVPDAVIYSCLHILAPCRTSHSVYGGTDRCDATHLPSATRPCAYKRMERRLTR